MGCKPLLIVYSILMFIAFLFVLVGTPIDMFRVKNVSYFSSKGCYTLWGYKAKCYSTKYTEKINTSMSGCTSRRDKFRAAEAFAIISIFVYGVAFIMGSVSQCCCSCLRWGALVFNIIGILLAVSWGCMANVYSKNAKLTLDKAKPGANYLLCSKLKAGSKYGAGFGLHVTAWCINLVCIILIVIPL